jgi:hypothetical protein
MIKYDHCKDVEKCSEREPREHLAVVGNIA